MVLYDHYMVNCLCPIVLYMYSQGKTVFFLIPSTVRLTLSSVSLLTPCRVRARRGRPRLPPLVFCSPVTKVRIARPIWAQAADNGPLPSPFASPPPPPPPWDGAPLFRVRPPTVAAYCQAHSLCMKLTRISKFYRATQHLDSYILLTSN